MNQFEQGDEILEFLIISIVYWMLKILKMLSLYPMILENFKFLKNDLIVV